MDTEPVEEPLDEKSKIVLFVIIGVLIIASLYFVYTNLSGQQQSIFSEIKQFYGLSFGNISIALVIAFLVSDVISSFNQYIMVPIVQSVFPGKDIWQRPVYLPRDKIMYPGLFFQAIVAFIMSVGVLFLIIYPLAKLIPVAIPGKKEKPKRMFGELSLYVFIVLIVLGLLIWNIIEILNPDITYSNVKSVPVSFQVKSFIPEHKVPTAKPDEKLEKQ